jgi:excisionase family DNA binding protein
MVLCSSKQEAKMLREPITMEPSEEVVGPASERLDLPESIYGILKDVVANMVRGKTILLMPQSNRLTTQAAANFLGFSRPHLVKLLESGVIPFERVGQHRRVLMKDLVTYRKNRDAERKQALNTLARSEYDSGSYEGLPIPDGGSDG